MSIERLRLDYGRTLLSALNLEKEGRWKEAERVYYDLVRFRLYSMFDSITAWDTRAMQEGRHRCYRRMRGDMS